MIAIKAGCFYNNLLFAFFMAWFLGCSACSGSGSDAITPAADENQGNDGASTDQAYIVEDVYANSSLGKIGSLKTMVLVGTYAEIGKAQGVLAGREILNLLNEVLIPFVYEQEPTAWDSYLIPQSKQFQFPEPYNRELQGIIEGIREKFADSAERMLPLLNREICIDDLHALNCFIDIYLAFSGCSSFSAWGSLTTGGEVIVGRNVDERYIPGYKPMFMAVAKWPTELQRKATIDITGPGIIGVSTSINADGMLIMGHDEQGLEALASNQWIPRSIVLREAIETLESTSDIDTIKRTFEHRPAKTGNNAHIVRPRESLVDPPSAVIEWDGNSYDNGASIRLPENDEINNAIACTNHFISRRSETFPSHSSSLKRYDILMNYLIDYRELQKIIAFEDAVEMMNSAAVNDTSITYCSVIAFPKKRELYVAVSPGQGTPATQSEWTLVTWDMLFGN